MRFHTPSASRCNTQVVGVGNTTVLEPSRAELWGPSRDPMDRRLCTPEGRVLNTGGIP
jgi:hypothetical protein